MNKAAHRRRNLGLVSSLKLRMSPHRELGYALEAYLREFSGDGYSAEDFIAYAVAQLMIPENTILGLNKTALRRVLLHILISLS